MHPNIELVQKLYGAFVAGDGETLAALLSPDIVWRTGRGANGGELHGIPAILEYLGADEQLEDYALDVVDMLASETRVAVVARTSARRGAARFTNDYVQLLAIDDGVVTDVRNYNWDRQALDEFMAAAV